MSNLQLSTKADQLHMLRGFLLVCALGAIVLAGCHGGNTNPPLTQHHAAVPPRHAMGGGSNQTFCEKTQDSVPSTGTAAQYNCYLAANSTVTVTADMEPFSAAVSGTTCTQETFSAVVNSGTPPQGLTVTASGTETGNSCTEIDSATATISTDSTLANNFGEVQYHLQSTFQYCGSPQAGCTTPSTVFAVINVYPGLHIDDKFSSQNIENQTVTHVAGQYMDLQPTLSNGNFDSSIGCSWSMPSYFPTDAVSAYATDVNPSSASPVPSTPVPANIGNGNVYWYNTRSEAPAQISVTCGVNDTNNADPSFNLTAVANLGFETPQPQVQITYGSVQLLNPYYDPTCTASGIRIGFGNPCTTVTPGPGIIWHYSINAGDSAEQGGVIGMWQIVNSSYIKVVDSNGTSISTPSPPAPCGDGIVPLESYVPNAVDGTQNWNVTWYDADAPNSFDMTTASYAEVDDYFDDYFMYSPKPGNSPGSSIWISLGHLYWGFSANTQSQQGYGPPFAPLTVTYATPPPSALDTNVVTPTFSGDCQ